MGASTPCPYAFSLTTSPFVTPNFRALAGLTRAALSQVNLVMGFGTSCNQPLLAKLPSPTEGSGRNTISIPPPIPFAAAGADDAPGVTGLGTKAEFAITPSFSEDSQNPSKSS